MLGKYTFAIFLGGLLGSFFAGPLYFIYYQFSGAYSFLLDGVVSLSSEPAWELIPYLILLFAIASIITSLIFLILLILIGHLKKEASVEIPSLIIGAAIHLMLFGLFLLMNETIRAHFNENALNLFSSGLGWTVILSFPFIFNYFFTLKKKTII